MSSTEIAIDLLCFIKVTHFSLPKNFYLLGLVQERNKDDNEMTQSFDETKECQCGKTVSTYCESCNMVICRKCFDESHNNRIWRKHKLVDPGQQRAIEKIRLLATTASSKKSRDIAALNTKQLPDLKKLKESFAAALEENIAVLDVSLTFFLKSGAFSSCFHSH